MASIRTHLILPSELVKQIDQLAGKRGRSQFVVEAAEREVLRLRQIKALKDAVGTWKDEDHPELRGGTKAWVRKLRRESDGRLKQLSR